MILRRIGGPSIDMPITQLNPYIHFNGDAEAAIRLYEQALGATVEVLMRYGEAPMPTPDTHKARIMHAQLRIDGHVLMLSDGPPDSTGVPGHAFHVALEYDDDADMARAFDLLAAGGEVVMPLQDMFWGGRLGMLVDRFSIRWMLIRNPRPT